ncbi:unnamed protein product, partial [Amoebophrya sp. A25]
SSLSFDVDAFFAGFDVAANYYGGVSKRRQRIHIRDDEDAAFVQTLLQADLDKQREMKGSETVSAQPSGTSATKKKITQALRNRAGPTGDADGTKGNKQSKDYDADGRQASRGDEDSSGPSSRKGQYQSGGSASSTSNKSGSSSATTEQDRNSSADVRSRLLTLYYLKHLKVLNGVSVTAEETQRATTMYAMRLQVEMVEELLQCE